MGDPTRDESEPTLELPSLFRRKRRRESDPEPPPESASDRAEGESAATEPAGPAGPAPEPPGVADPTPTEPTPTKPTPDPVPTEPTPTEPAPPSTDDTLTSPGAAREPTRPSPAPVAATAQPRRARPSLGTGPQLPATVAAPLTGLLVGLLGVLLTYGGLRGCEVVRGTGSCGGGPGLLLLVGILVVMVLVGTALLAWLHVPEPRSTSFLGVGVTAVVAMVALLEAVFSAWMFVVVPLVTAAAYLLAWWVTSRVVDQLDDGPGVDVR